MYRTIDLSIVLSKIMEERMSSLKGMTKVGETFVIKSSMRPEQMPDLEKLADDIVATLK